MSRIRRLAAYGVTLSAVVLFSGVSAFAESRPSRETRIKRDQRSESRKNRPPARVEARRGDDSATTRRRAEVRERAGERREVRGNDRDRRRESARAPQRSARQDRQRTETYRSPRNDSRRAPVYQGGSRHSGRQPYYAKGRVSKVNPYHGGYRVWVHGARYPFFVPASHWHRDRFRPGIVINIGGFYNPRGYYDYYDGRGVSAGYLRGVVESVDYRRDTFVLRNDASGSYVTVVMRDRRDQVRPGDYVEMDGTWSRAGVFQARNVEFLDYTYGR